MQKYNNSHLLQQTLSLLREKHAYNKTAIVKGRDENNHTLMLIKEKPLS